MRFAVGLGLTLAAVLVASASRGLAETPPAGSAGAAETSAGAGNPPARTEIAPDPAVRRGVLANGLRYAVRSNARPTGGLSIRLGLDVGSFEETDDQRGAAHFVEHLAFGRDAPGAQPEAAFAAAGVAFAHDRNAETDAYSTVYRIDIPKADDRTVDIAFAWLRTVADGADLSEAAVARERGVILAERTADLSAETETSRARLAFLLPGQRFLDRDPIGTPESLAAMTSERLRGFYRAWYRPGNAVVVVVGDAPAETLEARVKTAFGSWAPGPTPPRAPYKPLANVAGVEALGQVQASAETRVDVCRPRAAPPKDPSDLDRLRTKTLGDLWLALLRARLTADAYDPTAAITQAMVSTTWETREAAGPCLTATASEDHWAPALARLKAEVDRLARTEPSEAELEAAMRGLRSSYRGAVNVAATRKSRDLATDLTNDMLAGEPTPSPAEAFAAFDDIVADITPADVKAAFVRDWAGSGPRIVVRAPTATPKAAILAAWSSGDAGLAQAPPAADSVWAYGDFGKAGKVARRETFTGPDFTRVTFANGVILNWMHTDFAARQAKVAVTFGAGRREIADADFGEAQVASLLFKQTGLGRHDFATLQRLFAERGWGADLAIGSDIYALRGEADERGMLAELQLLAAYVSDPGFRNVDPLIATLVSAFYRRYVTVPALVAGQAINEAVSPGGPTSIPPRERLARMRTADMKRLFGPALAQAPLRVDIVGDVTEKDAVTWVGETFGALPARPTAPRPSPGATFLRFPAAAPPPIEATHEGPTEQAVVEMIWPLYVAEPSRRREEYSLELVAALLRERLLHRLRDDLGKTYAPQAETSMPDNADQGDLEALVETAPADLELTRREMAGVALSLAKGDFTAADLEAARAPLLSRWSEQEHTNSLWLAALAATAVSDDAPRELTARRAVAASLTLDEVKAAAARWLGPPPIVALVRPKPGAVSGAGS